MYNQNRLTEKSFCFFVIVRRHRTHVFTLVEHFSHEGGCRNETHIYTHILEIIKNLWIVIKLIQIYSRWIRLN